MTEPFQGDSNHAWDTPESIANFTVAWQTMRDLPGCPHCTVHHWPLALSGTAWGWETFHEPHCPEHDDNQEAVAVRVTEHFNGAEYMQAEAIWSASQDDPRGNQ
jgi:hypothetical protein